MYDDLRSVLTQSSGWCSARRSTQKILMYAHELQRRGVSKGTLANGELLCTRVRHFLHLNSSVSPANKRALRVRQATRCLSVLKVTVH